jgi:plasmid stabilization system protein ParE
MKIQWTQTAFESLAEIRRSMAREKSPAKARQWLDSVFASANRLIDFPHMGAETGGKDGFREMQLGGYRMKYRVEGPDIIILGFQAGVATAEGGDEFPNV